MKGLYYDALVIYESCGSNKAVHFRPSRYIYVIDVHLHTNAVKPTDVGINISQVLKMFFYAGDHLQNLQ